MLNNFREDSILNYSMNLFEVEDIASPSNRTNVASSTQRPARSSLTFSQPSFPTTSHSSSSHIPNQTNVHTCAQIWKWNLKFCGTLGTMNVIEFFRRVSECALARGATSAEVFDGASELFDGSARSWFRAGMKAGLFKCWEDVETELKKDFQSYDYSDSL